MVDEEQVTERVVTTPVVPPYATPVAAPQYAAPVAPQYVAPAAPPVYASAAPPVYAAPVVGEAVTTRTVTHRNSASELLRRIVIFVFALIQIVIVLRIVLLLINASRSNDIVQAIYNVSALFVDPFEGILRTGALTKGASALDVSAIVALVGWSVLEVIILAAINITRRER